MFEYLVRLVGTMKTVIPDSCFTNLEVVLILGLFKYNCQAMQHTIQRSILGIKAHDVANEAPLQYRDSVRNLTEM